MSSEGHALHTRSDKPCLPSLRTSFSKDKISFSVLSNSLPVALIGRVSHKIDTEGICADKFVRSNAPKLDNVLAKSEGSFKKVDEVFWGLTSTRDSVEV